MLYLFSLQILRVFLRAGSFSKILSYLKNLFNKNKKEKCLVQFL